MKILILIGLNIYVYCTDFVINLANIFGLSYYEINFTVFCVLYPLLLVGSFTLYVIQRFRLRMVRRVA